MLLLETASRAGVAKLASQKKQTQALHRDKKKKVIVDEAEVAKQKYSNVLVGSSNQTFLIDCHVLDSRGNINSNIVLHSVDDILRQLKQNSRIFHCS